MSSIQEKIDATNKAITVLQNTKEVLQKAFGVTPDAPAVDVSDLDKTWKDLFGDGLGL